MLLTKEAQGIRRRICAAAARFFAFSLRCKKRRCTCFARRRRLAFFNLRAIYRPRLYIIRTRSYEDFLARVPLLAGLEAYERARIADALVTASYEDRQYIIRQGEVRARACFCGLI